MSAGWAGRRTSRFPVPRMLQHALGQLQSESRGYVSSLFSQTFDFSKDAVILHVPVQVAVAILFLDSKGAHADVLENTIQGNLRAYDITVSIVV